MGLFGGNKEKKPCACCGKPLGMLNGDIILADGEICFDCWKNAGFGLSTLGASKYTLAQLAEHRKEAEAKRAEQALKKKEAEEELARLRSVVPEKTIGPVAFNDTEGVVRVSFSNIFEPDQYFRYRQILDFELLQDGESIAKSKGGLGSAVVGGMLLGPAGLVAGAVLGGKKTKTKNVCTSMKVKITLRDNDPDVIYIDLITKETKCSSGAYKNAAKQAQDILSALQVAADKAAAETAAQPVVVNTAVPSAADELIKYKQLLDAGAITQEEFDTKKKQLLGL